MTWIISITLSPIVAYLALSGLYQLILALASKVEQRESVTSPEKQNKFLILVPAYREDAVILNSTVRNLALKYEYHTDLFDYVVISDGLKAETNAELRQLGAIVHEVNFEKSTKVKSLQSAMQRYQQGYDAVLVLDADNVMRMDFLQKANLYLNQGFKALQGQRIAANNQTAMALLDGLSETANNAILCKGANRFGLSSKLSGSGMVFEFGLFQKVVSTLTAIGGFDKEMELKLTAQQVYIKYAENMVLTDEKVASTAAYSRQRGRWLESQYSFLRKEFKPALKALSLGNRDFFHKTLQLALPPRALAPFALLLLTELGYLLVDLVFYTSFAGLAANISSYLISLPKGPLFRQSWRIATALPGLLVSTLKALSWMKQSKTEFLHTPHNLAQG